MDEEMKRNGKIFMLASLREPATTRFAPTMNVGARFVPSDGEQHQQQQQQERVPRFLFIGKNFRNCRAKSLFTELFLLPLVVEFFWSFCFFSLRYLVDMSRGELELGDNSRALWLEI